MPPRKRPRAKQPERDAGDISDDDDPMHDTRKRTKGSSRSVSTYFLPQNAGSSKTLADLRLDHVDEAEMRALLSKLPQTHAAEKAAIRSRHEAAFDQWWAQIRAGNSLLLYGFGSKRQLLHSFAQSHTKDGACLTVDGLQPGLSARRILIWVAALAKLTKPQHYRNYSKPDLLELIRSEHPHRHLYLLINNIDGAGLRDATAQRLLSEIAAVPNVHVVATADHANAPLLWDMQTKDRFRWVWANVTGYEGYGREIVTAAVPSLLAGRSDEVTRQSAEVVLASLSNNAREVFRIIADAQLDPEGDHGVSFERLFTSCRDRFLVSNDSLLKAFLVEFRDHDLLVTKRGAEGGELMHVPLSDEALMEVLAAMEQMQGGAQQ